MKAEVRRLPEIITTSKLYCIPFFQRSYVWDKEQWERFAKDMEELIDRNSSYFLGSLILKIEEPSDADIANRIYSLLEVIDGQQRLTTLFIYMKLLYTITGSTDTFDHMFQYRYNGNDVYMPLLKHNHFDAPNFNRVMKLDTATEQKGEDGISKAFEFFRKRYTEEIKIDIQNLINAVMQHIRFVEIIVEDKDDEQQIFDTINSLGVDLNTDELMKNFLYKSEEDQKSYNNYWKPVFDSKEVREFWKSDAITGKKCDKKENKAIENFFHAFVRIKMNDERLNLTSEQKTLFKRKDYTFKACKTFVEQGISREELTQDIVEYAQRYNEILNPEILNKAIPQSGAERLSYIILATSTKTVIPYLLYILKNVEDKDEQNRIFDYLETYIIRRKLAISADQNKSYSELFGESLILNKILTPEDLKKFIEEKDITDNLAMPDNRKVENGIKERNSKLDEKTARTILYLIEQKAKPQANISLNDILATELMPVKETCGWKFDESTDEKEARVQRTKTFGNYFIYNNEGKKHVQAARGPLEKIRHIHSYGGVYGTNNLLLRPENKQLKDNWTSNDINNRNMAIAQIVTEKAWPL